MRANGQRMTFGYAALREIGVKVLLINTVANSFTFGLAGILDVLSGIGDLCICTAYRGNERTFSEFPYHQSVLHNVEGDYEVMPGWDEDLGEVRDEADLPQAARDYLAFISDYLGVPIALIGVGPGRDQNVWTAAGRSSVLFRDAAAVSGA